MNDLVNSDDVFFAASGITDGEFLQGVRYRGDLAETSSIMMRARSGTIRRCETHHHLDLKRSLSERVTVSSPTERTLDFVS